MDCSRVHKHLIFYIEGSLEADNFSAMEEHLRICNECSSFADMLRASLNVIEQEKKIIDDNDFTGKVMARINSGERVVNTYLVRIIRYAAAAAIVIIGVFTGINIAKVASGSGEYRTGELSDEEYYLNDMYQEPIESFFLLKNEDNE